MRVDPHGPQNHSGTPILVPDGHFDPESVLSGLAREGRGLPQDVVGLVRDKLVRYP